MSELRTRWLSFYAANVEPVYKEIVSHIEKMLIGTLIVSTIAAVLTYPSVYWLVKAYQSRRAADRNLPTDPTAHVSNAHEIPLEPQPVSRSVDPTVDRHATVVSV